MRDQFGNPVGVGILVAKAVRLAGHHLGGGKPALGHDAVAVLGGIALHARAGVLKNTSTLCALAYSLAGDTMSIWGCIHLGTSGGTADAIGAMAGSIGRRPPNWSG